MLVFVSTPEPVYAVRFFFALPETISLPDGLAFTEAVAPSSDTHGDPLTHPAVSVIYHQIVLGRELHEVPILSVAVELYPQLGAQPSSSMTTQIEKEASTAHHRYTVVEALATFTDERDDHLGAMRAALETCLRLVQDHVRAYRLSVSHAVELPNVANIADGLVAFGATGERLLTGKGVLTSIEPNWALENISSPGFMVRLEEETFDADPANFSYWMREIRSGNPLIAWRDRTFAARRAHLRGDLLGAVLHTATAAEILLDRLLMMLLWESKTPPGDVARIFEEGQLIKRIQRELAPRLRGNWQTGQPGPVRDWYQNISRLRNRVVHGGYVPRDPEAALAFDAMVQLETFAFDRLADRRNEYPRCVLLTLGPEGLKRRGLWNGKIRLFVESGEASREANWQTSFRSWRDTVNGPLA